MISQPPVAPMPPPPVRITWSMLRLPEFWIFAALTAAGIVAKSSRWGLDSAVHELAVGALIFLGAISAWLTQRAREAPSPVQEAVIDSKQNQIDVQAEMLASKERVILQQNVALASSAAVAAAAATCVAKNHPETGPIGPAGPVGPAGPAGPEGPAGRTTPVSLPAVPL